MSSSISQRSLLSQNFLKDPCLVAALLDRFHLESDSAVYEIGPGKGIITEQLARRYRQVVAIEKDPHLAHMLLRKFNAWPNVTIHSGDFLRYRLPPHPYNVFANIPFSITAAIMAKLTAAERSPDVAYLVMQHEAADMFMGKPRESLRTILLKPWFETEIVHRFQRGDFMPAPRVDVVMLRLRKRGPPLVCNADRQYFRDFVVHVFTHWQSTGANPLQGIFTRQQLNSIEQEMRFDRNVTPTLLTFAQWLTLFKYLKTGEKTGEKTGKNRRALQVIVGSEKRLLQQQRRLQKIHRTRAKPRKL